MLTLLWFNYLYQPIFNALVWIYTFVADRNLGWAVIWLTIFLRVILLPLTILSERNAVRQSKVEAEAAAAAKAFRNDAVAQKEAFKRIVKKHKLSPWAKVLTLLVQALVLVLLYQVFMQGIRNNQVSKVLYPFIDFPGRMNADFYGFNIGAAHDWIWAGVAAVYLLLSIYLDNRHQSKWQKSEFYYLIFFPLFTFVALWWLPMVKSLFILTSMIFSDIITLLRKLLFPVKAS